MKQKLFGRYTFWKFIVFGFLQALFILFIVCYSVERDSVNPDGHPASLAVIGLIIYCAVVFSVNIEMLYVTYSHSIFSVFLVLVSVGCYFAFYKIQDKIKLLPDLAGTSSYMWHSPSIIFIIVFKVFFQLAIQSTLAWIVKLKDMEKYLPQNIANSIMPFNRQISGQVASR